MLPHAASCVLRYSCSPSATACRPCIDSSSSMPRFPSSVAAPLLQLLLQLLFACLPSGQVRPSPGCQHAPAVSSRYLLLLLLTPRRPDTST